MRTEFCGNLRQSHIGKKITLCGWVNRYCNLGKIIFIDIRDCKGIVQVFFDINKNKSLKLASELRNEFCIQVIGTVRARKKEKINFDIKTGTIEILASSFSILSKSESLPLELNYSNTEEVRLKYRYLDLRRKEVSDRLKIRSKITSFIHFFMKKHNFLNIETPMLAKATPEGARDYLVSSRLHKEKFYALPQSPQLFKQLLMISGFDRYYQIVKCFRDEDLRSDRQPEFTQIDVETSFMTVENFRKKMEMLIHDLWLEINGTNLKDFPVITFNEANRRYGSDKPDLRNPIELIDITDLTNTIKLKSSFEPKDDNFKKKTIAICVPNGASLDLKQIENYNNFVKNFGIKKLIHIKITNFKKNTEGIISPIKNLLNNNFIKLLLSRIKPNNGDIIFFSSGKNNVLTKGLGKLRTKLGKDLKLIKKKWAPVWIIDFPMFEDDGKGGLTTTHHPFCLPKNINSKELKISPEKAISNTYDMVINGHEIGSGSMRIQNSEMQKSVFDVLGINEEEQKQKFGFFLNAMKYGTPPHAGLAFGLDRIAMLLSKTDNIRDVIAFPKTTNASCIMTEAPSFVNLKTIDRLKK